ncbi:hypothetical protein Tco_1309868 [Tanacetum coccineum]
MSSPNHSTSNIEDAFSSMNILNYTSVSSDYFPASSGSISFNSSENSNIIPSVISPFYNNPCLKDVQAFYAKESPISPPDPITPPAILTPSLIAAFIINENLGIHEVVTIIQYLILNPEYLSTATSSSYILCFSSRVGNYGMLLALP